MFSMANATTPEENKATGVAFLAENAKKPNIVTTATGLQYEVLTPGTGTV
ncbi:MAG: FKBP-type peptidyl-prolyl cis-trans isomerase N-terminal domain-containing protein, partial [Methylobacter sp.]